MNAFAKTIGGVVAVALLVAIAAAAWLGFQYVAALFAALDPQVAKVTGIACIVLVLAAWMIARGTATAHRESKAIAFREEQAATYQLFVDFWQNMLQRAPVRGNQLPGDLTEKLELIDRLMALYGGAAVIKAHTALRDLERKKGASDAAVRAKFGEALVIVRKELGTDTPYNIGHELERLLLPAADVAPGATALAPTA